MSNLTTTRPSALAGRWYPADPGQLSKTVDRYLAEADLPELEGRLIGLISPHAGHQYSGPVAGCSFAAAASTTPELVVILSPLHQPADGSLVTTAHDAYQTPLGKIPVDKTVLKSLEILLNSRAGLSLNQIVRDQEHAIEILLPFLQRALSHPFHILPIMLRDQRPAAARALADSLAALLTDQQVLLIASTDLSHFYSAEQAKELDQVIIDRILELNPEGIYQAEAQGRGFACGKGALAAVLWAAKELGANHAAHLKYAHSGETSGDDSRVVGYEAAALLGD